MYHNPKRDLEILRGAKCDDDRRQQHNNTTKKEERATTAHTHTSSLFNQGQELLKMSSRPSKRKRTGSQEDNSRSIVPDGMVSSSAGAAAGAQDIITITNTDDESEDEEEPEMNMRLALRMLYQKGVANLWPVIEFLNSLADMDDFKVLTSMCKELVDLQGLSILIFGLETYRESQAFCVAVIGVLCEVTCRVDRSCAILVDLQAVAPILAAAKEHGENAEISADTVSVLLNMNINEESTDAVIGEDCMDYCLDVMKKFRNDMHVRTNGVRYFTEMTKIADLKQDLLDRQVDILFRDAIRKFGDDKKYAYESSICKESRERLSSKK